MALSDKVDFKDANISLREKWKRHVQHKRRTGIQMNPNVVNYFGPVLYFYTIGVGSLWFFVDVLPTLYAEEWQDWLLTVNLLLVLLVVEVAVNWCGIRYVDSTYQPSLHGTKPSNFPPDYERDRQLEASKDSRQNADRAAFVGLEKVSSEGGEESRDSQCGKRNLINTESPAPSTNGDVGAERGAMDPDYAPPEAGGSKKYDGYSFRMMVATSLPTADGEIERKPYPYWSWVPCLMCQRLRPPRCHHCVLCKQCVLKRDHHCYFTGRCIGVNNTRFFFMFLFWAFLLTSFGTFHIVFFVSRHMMSRYNLGAFDLLFPVPLVRGVLGYVSLMATPLVLAMWCIFFCNVFSLLMMTGFLHLFFKGKTSFESDHYIKITDTRSLGGKLKAVFGEYWWLNFLVPTYPWIRPAEDAVLWPHIKPW